MTMEEPFLLLFFLMLAVFSWPATAQGPSSSTENNTNTDNPYDDLATNFNPSMAIIVVILITAFFFLGFFSIYIRQCSRSDNDGSGVAGAATAVRSRRGTQGMDPEVLATFPTLVYSEVKGLKIGKAALECAVCLSEFEDDERLRLLPKCRHVFHPDCIDAWLASHVTCPVCRANLTDSAAAVVDLELAAAGERSPSHGEEGEESPERMDRPMISGPSSDHVAIDVDEDDRKADLLELARIGNERRSARFKRFRYERSHSTGHSLAATVGEDNHERFTLRLPDHVHKQIIAAGRLKRASSCVVYRASAEGSSPRGVRIGEGSSRAAWRSARFGWSDRWSSLISRTITTRLPAWSTGRRPDGEGSSRKRNAGEGSLRKREAGEGSFKGKLQYVNPLECLGGGAKPPAGDDESSTVAFARF